jgi:OOP family OmpA-OmpF porin
MENVLETARAALSGETVGRVSSLLHESESGTRQGWQEALPVSVAGLASQAATPEGAQALLATLKEGRYAHVEPEDLRQTVADPRMAERVVSSGEGMVGRLFGDKLNGIIDALAGAAGVSRSSASKLLGLATPLVMGIVGKLATTRNLDARGLSGFLGEQQRLAVAAMPSRLAGVLGLQPAYAGGANPAHHSERVARIGHEAAHGRSIVPWVMGVLVLLAGLVWLNNRRTHQRAREQPVATAPAQPTTTASGAQPVPGNVVEPLSAAGGTAGLTRILESDQPLPARFVISDLMFQGDTANIDLQSARILDDVAGVLAAHPAAALRIEGHTDATGAPDTALALSQQRAEAVKSYLTAQGIAPDRIATAGFGATKPLDAPSAPNRRIELVITGR